MNVKTKVTLGALFLFGISATPFLAGLTLLAQRSIAADPSPVNQAKAINPFKGVTIGTLPAFSKAVNVQLPPQAQTLLKVSQIAAAKGETPDKKMPFSVWQTSFGAGELSPNQAANLSETPPAVGQAMALSNFKFLQNTSVGEFIAANPQLANLPVNSLPVGLFPQVIPSALGITPTSLGQMAADINY